MKPYKLLIFDWDGTLCDSTAHITQSMQTAIAELGLPAPTDEQIRTQIGIDFLALIEALFPELDRGQHVQLKQLFHLHYFAKTTPSCLYKNTIETLTKLKDAGFSLAIATGKSRHSLDEAMQETALNTLIDISRCSEETLSKPHPMMLQEIMNELGYTEAHTLMIGDTEYDLQLAKNAGVDSVAVYHGVHDQDTLQSHGPKACVPNLNAFYDWLIEE